MQTSTKTIQAQTAITLAYAAVNFQPNTIPNSSILAKPANALALKLELATARPATRISYYIRIAQYAATNRKVWGRYPARRYCELRQVPLAYYFQAMRSQIADSIKCETCEIKLPAYLRIQAD